MFDTILDDLGLYDAWQKVRAFFKWVYDWITVLTGLLVGVLSYGFDVFNAIVGATDLTPILPSKYAVEIMTLVALLKGAHAWYAHRKAA